MHTITQFPGA